MERAERKQAGVPGAPVGDGGAGAEARGRDRGAAAGGAGADDQ